MMNTVGSLPSRTCTSSQDGLSRGSKSSALGSVSESLRLLSKGLMSKPGSDALNLLNTLCVIHAL